MNIAQLMEEGLERFGDERRTVFEGRRYGNADMDHMAWRLADRLTDAGVGRGDRVVVMMLNAPEVIGVFLACWRLGAVIVPLTPQWTAVEVVQVLSDCQPKFAFASDETAGVLRAAADLAKLELSIQSLRAGETSTEKYDGRRSIAEVSGADTALILYTSGTTGRPKGVVLGHANLMAATRMVYEPNRDLEQSRGLLILPLSHIYGILMMNLGFMLGSRSVVLRHYDTLQMLETIQSFRVEQLSVVPTMMTYLLNHPELSRFDLSSLDTVSSGGAPLPEALRAEFEERIGCRVIQGYGMSETGGVIAGYGSAESYRPGSVGRAWPGSEITILDDDGRPVAAGQQGEICVKGPQVMSAYLNRPDETAAALAGGWLHTGDIGRLSDDGYLTITDRKKELIIKGGENISPREIEDALYAYPSVREAAAFGVPDAVFGEQVVAAVVLRAGSSHDLAPLRAHLEACLMRFKQPMDLMILDDLPKAANGKIKRRSVRELYLQR